MRTNSDGVEWLRWQWLLSLRGTSSIETETIHSDSDLNHRMSIRCLRSTCLHRKLQLRQDTKHRSCNYLLQQMIHFPAETPSDNSATYFKSSEGHLTTGFLSIADESPIVNKRIWKKTSLIQPQHSRREASEIFSDH